MVKPVIGITPTLYTDEASHGTFERMSLALLYAEAVRAAGGMPIVLPPHDHEPHDVFDLVDALLITGGPDLDPSLYGDDTVHPATYGISALRDQFELRLLRQAVARDVPVLAICRGIQVMNVAFGGTLYQHLPDDIGTDVVHRQHEAGVAFDQPGHDVTIAPDTLLSRVYGEERLAVNSFHHQAIKDLAPSLRATAVAPDGIIEAAEVPAARFALGVQWHPEMMFQTHAHHLAPFAALVEAARIPARSGASGA